jgi:flagellar biosynthetic protein FliQ
VEPDRALIFLNQLVWTACLVSAPLLIIVLLVGLVVSVLQVATQVQEATLSYVPKMIAAAAVLLLLGGWMLARLSQFASGVYQTIPSLSH